MNKFEILRRISKVQRDNGKEFTVNDKLNAIREVVKDSSYREVYTGNLTSVFARLSDEELKSVEMPVLLTSHIDNVDEIKHPFVSEFNHKKYGRCIRGTFDNMITNAALCDLMLNQDIKENVIFCFDGDEETGRCRGLKEAADWIKEICDNEIGFVIATDVTEEGFGRYSYSLENMSGSASFQEAFSGFFKSRSDFAFAPHPSEVFKIPESMKKFYSKNHTGWCDEAFEVRSLNLNGASICLPIKGEMHSDKGCFTKEETFVKYTKRLGEVMNYAAVLDKEKVAVKEERKTVSYVGYYNNPNEDIDYPDYSYSTIDDDYGMPYFEENSLKKFRRRTEGIKDEGSMSAAIYEFLITEGHIDGESAENLLNSLYDEYYYNSSYEDNSEEEDICDFMKDRIEEWINDLQYEEDGLEDELGFSTPNEEEVENIESRYFNQLYLGDEENYTDYGL